MANCRVAERQRLVIGVECGQWLSARKVERRGEEVRRWICTRSSVTVDWMLIASEGWN